MFKHPTLFSSNTDSSHFIHQHYPIHFLPPHSYPPVYLRPLYNFCFQYASAHLSPRSLDSLLPSRYYTTSPDPSSIHLLAATIFPFSFSNSQLALPLFPPPLLTPPPAHPAILPLSCFQLLTSGGAEAQANMSRGGAAPRYHVVMTEATIFCDGYRDEQKLYSTPSTRNKPIGSTLKLQSVDWPRSGQENSGLHAQLRNVIQAGSARLRKPCASRLYLPLRKPSHDRELENPYPRDVDGVGCTLHRATRRLRKARKDKPIRARLRAPPKATTLNRGRTQARNRCYQPYRHAPSQATRNPNSRRPARGYRQSYRKPIHRRSGNVQTAQNLTGRTEYH